MFRVKSGKNIKFFLIVFLLNLPFWWAVNTFQEFVEEVFLARKIIETPPGFFIAAISQNYPFNKIKIREDVSLSAESAISLEVGKGKAGIIFEKNPDKKMPIASLTKLLVALVALDFYEPGMEIEISNRAIAQAEEIGQLSLGEILTVQDLLHIMLIESSNDAAFALAEPMTIKGFVDLMNFKAKDYGMENSSFFEPTGLDVDQSREENGRFNFSTAKDLAKLTEEILKRPLLVEILSKEEHSLYSKNGQLHHILRNTNKLLNNEKVLFGKTGYTEKAGGCLIEVIKTRNQGSYIINVLLNSQQRFKDMETLIDALNN